MSGPREPQVLITVDLRRTPHPVIVTIRIIGIILESYDIPIKKSLLQGGGSS